MSDKVIFISTAFLLRSGTSICYPVSEDSMQTACYIIHGNVSAIFLIFGQDVCLFAKKEDVAVTSV